LPFCDETEVLRTGLRVTSHHLNPLKHKGSLARNREKGTAAGWAEFR
jgi:hypothetical protein